ncbi:minor histocompatibility protein HB-1 [Piliocolobus tephrosceles]|uniref:minor histocompatibility protein HB-1 n=1 Tax=Piliocolobus tephrosceles TaxID=591936 RepID=UPI000E6B1C24|nr:minor histocompatibility protein HB-1 [Piliocolobus tephrosceles]
MSEVTEKHGQDFWQARVFLMEKPELEEQPECREEKRGSLHVWKSELVEVEDDVYLRHSSSLTHGP